MVAPAYSSLELVRESFDARAPAELAEATQAGSANIPANIPANAHHAQRTTRSNISLA
jgi:hypothetical protein